MKTWGYLGLAMALAFAMVVTVAPTRVEAAQDCGGNGSGGVGGLPFEGSKRANLDGDGPKNDLVETFFDTNSGNARVRVTLDNGYRAVTGDLFVGFGIDIGAVADVDQDGDDEIFIFELLGPASQIVQPYVFAHCGLVIPQLNGSDFFGGFGGNSGGGSEGMDCFAPSQAGKGITTYATEYQMQFDQYQSTRKEYKLVVNDDSGAANVTLQYENTLTYKSDRMQAVSDWRANFNCSPAPKCDGKRATIQGTPARDVINGSGKKDVIASLAGDDKITAKGGNDVICSGSGKDTVSGGGGGDIVFAGDGNDKVEGGKGADTMYGEGGNDTLLGGPGSDKAFGGPGADSCTAEVKNSC